MPKNVYHKKEITRIIARATYIILDSANVLHLQHENFLLRINNENKFIRINLRRLSNSRMELLRSYILIL